MAKKNRKSDWQKRKQAYLAYPETAEDDVPSASLADNVRTNLRDLRKPDVDAVPVQPASREDALVLPQPSRQIPRTVTQPIRRRIA
jgi:hypothetical protein